MFSLSAVGVFIIAAVVLGLVGAAAGAVIAVIFDFPSFPSTLIGASIVAFGGIVLGSRPIVPVTECE
jgi:glycopeptide antibiotics resistance protein